VLVVVKKFIYSVKFIQLEGVIGFEAIFHAL
jgi:hypothetical protein